MKVSGEDDPNVLDDQGNRWIGTTWFGYQGPWMIGLEWGEIDGIAECIGFSIRCYRKTPQDGKVVDSPDGRAEALTATLLREVNLGTLIREKRQKTRETAQFLRGIDNDRGPDPELFKPRKGPKGQRREWTSRDLVAVAHVYVEAMDAKEPPRKAVAEAFDVSGSMASKLIRKARDAELLGETTQGKAGGAAGFLDAIEGEAA